MRRFVFCAMCVLLISASPNQAEDNASDWRSLPLIQNGKVAAGWTHLGWGGFAVDDGSLRTANAPEGMGLLLYDKEKFGHCQIRVVYKSRDGKANAGVFVRIDDGILDWRGKKTTAVRRDKAGKLSEAELKKLMDASAAEEGPWYAVHHGYEVQICDDADAAHRTGAVYSLAKAAQSKKKQPGDWRTMVITLEGTRLLVDLDGQRVTTFDSADKVSSERQWHEPRREPRRPEVGYIGLQNHDPGDVVWFKEVSVRQLMKR
jgi:hydrogenase maturation factor